MLKHESVWAAIDALAASNRLSASALAKKAGLDPTTFNKSKRLSSDGRPRWPSTESVAKIMEATGATLDEFMRLIAGRTMRAPETKSLRAAKAPLMGSAQAGVGGYFDDAGFPSGEGWEHIDYPAGNGSPAYALKVAGDSMMPLYRDGDTIIVEPGALVRRGDRVVVRTKAGEVMAKILLRHSGSSVELMSFNPEHRDRVFDNKDIDWMARIIWASQ
jgi:phage repressor protein C with HTH and peptisase S24 domain